MNWSRKWPIDESMPQPFDANTAYRTDTFGTPRPGTATGEHEGEDYVLTAKWIARNGRRIPVIQNSSRVLFSGQTWGYKYFWNSDKNIWELRKVIDYGVVTETPFWYVVIWHLRPQNLPRVGETLHVGDFYGEMSDHFHIGVFRKFGKWPGVQEAEKEGWSVDPSAVEWKKETAMDLRFWMPRMDAVGIIRKFLQNLETSDDEKKRWLEQGLDLDHFLNAGLSEINQRHADEINRLKDQHAKQLLDMVPRYDLEQANNALGEVRSEVVDLKIRLDRATKEVDNLKSQLKIAEDQIEYKNEQIKDLAIRASFAEANYQNLKIQYDKLVQHGADALTVTELLMLAIKKLAGR